MRVIFQANDIGRILSLVSLLPALFMVGCSVESRENGNTETVGIVKRFITFPDSSKQRISRLELWMDPQTGKGNRYLINGVRDVEGLHRRLCCYSDTSLPSFGKAKHAFPIMYRCLFADGRSLEGNGRLVFFRKRTYIDMVIGHDHGFFFSSGFFRIIHLDGALDEKTIDGLRKAFLEGEIPEPYPDSDSD